ncbi:hypothetical protein DU53_05290 [Kosmotoga sp. DU53]|nr:hypothetical protein DU53_05290 [Kosmotoga sp. DU53]
MAMPLTLGATTSLTKKGTASCIKSESPRPENPRNQEQRILNHVQDDGFTKRRFISRQLPQASCFSQTLLFFQSPVSNIQSRS